ncbi:MAG: hypothetical protein V3T31_07775 [candidate division Zixibacteria bacterium]
MFQTRFFKRILSSVLIMIALLATALCSGCGDDEEPPDPVSPPIVEIHMVDVVRVPVLGLDAVPMIPASVAAEGLNAVNGLIYKKKRTEDTLDYPLSFDFLDAGLQRVADAQIVLSLLEGDGTLGDASLTSLADTSVATTYRFIGALGHALLQASAGGDTLKLMIRSDTLIWGAQGQAQYITFADTFGTVIDVLGTTTVDMDPRANVYLYYVDYESELHLVEIIEDSTLGGDVDDFEPVVGTILTDGYAEKLPEGVGVRSTYAEMIAAYGQPDSTGFDGVFQPFTDIYFYWEEGMVFFVLAGSSKASGSYLIPTSSNVYGPSGTTTQRYRPLIRRQR